MQSSHLQNIALFLSLQTVHIKVPRISYPSHWRSSQRLSNLPQSLGDQIRKHRLELHWLQADLAKVIGVHVVSVSNWERGTSTPSRRMMKRIQEFLDYTPKPVPESTTTSLCAWRCEMDEATSQDCLFEKICKQPNPSTLHLRVYATALPKVRARHCLLATEFCASHGTRIYHPATGAFKSQRHLRPSVAAPRLVLTRS